MENPNRENVIINFHADWCSPCKLQKPILEKFAKENNIEIEDVDIEENCEMAQKYGIRSVPTMVYTRNNIIVETLVGLQKESLLKAKLLKNY